MALALYLLVDILGVSFLCLAEREVSHSTRSELLSKYSLTKIKNNRIKVYLLYIVVSFAIMFLLIALRDNVGKDYGTYMNAYRSTVNGTLSQAQKDWLSLGYRVLSLAVGVVAGDNYIIMFAVVGFLTLYFIYKSIIHNSINWTVSLFTYICFCLYYQSMNQVRQLLAVAIALYGFMYLKNNENIKYIIVILIAGLMHTSALVLLVLLIVKKWNITIKNMLIYVVTCGISYISFDSILNMLSYTNYGKIYLGWDKFNTSFELSSVLNLFIRVVILIICLVVSKETIKRSPYTITLYNAVIICTLLQVWTLKSYLFSRITTYFFVFYIILIPEVMKSYEDFLSKSSIKIFRTVFVVLMLAYHFVYYFSSSGASGSGYDYYRTILF